MKKDLMHRIETLKKMNNNLSKQSLMNNKEIEEERQTYIKYIEDNYEQLDNEVNNYNIYKYGEKFLLNTSKYILILFVVFLGIYLLGFINKNIANEISGFFLSFITSIFLLGIYANFKKNTHILHKYFIMH